MWIGPLETAHGIRHVLAATLPDSCPCSILSGSFILSESLNDAL
jgi:hypothetical protein